MVTRLRSKPGQESAIIKTQVLQKCLTTTKYNGKLQLEEVSKKEITPFMVKITDVAYNEGADWIANYDEDVSSGVPYNAAAFRSSIGQLSGYTGQR